MSNSIFEYLQSQNQAVLNNLYGRESADASGRISKNVQAPFVAKAVFQSISAVAKNYVMRLIFVNHAMTYLEMGDWMIHGARRAEHLAVLSELIKMHILEEEIQMDVDIDDDEGGRSHYRRGDIQEVIDPRYDNVTGAKYRINSYFRESLKQAISNPEEPWALEKAGGLTSFNSTAVKVEDGQRGDANKPSKSFLEKMSLEKWDALLRFLLGIEGSSLVTPGGTIDNFVCRTGLMQNRGAHAKKYDSAKRTRTQVMNLQISARGYEYMLKSYQQQVWLFVYETIQHIEGRDDLLSLLFMLSYCEFGEGYPLAALTSAQHALVLEFSAVGLVYVGDRASYEDGGQFYPSYIAINMMFKSFGPQTQSLYKRTQVGNEGEEAASQKGDVEGSSLGMKINQSMEQQTNLPGQSGAAAARVAPGSLAPAPGPPPLTSGLQIVVETNMQVVAYLTSPLHLALLGLFVEFAVQMPNVAIGKISRDKAKDAFDLGIRVDQIIDFLCVHAHNLTKHEKPVIPNNVVDQLVLWESEKFRIKDTESILVDFTKLSSVRVGFGSDSGGMTREQFLDVEKQAKRIKASLFSDVEQMLMVFTFDGYDQIRSYMEDKYNIASA